MINFDEELRKFAESMELENIEGAVQSTNLTDVLDATISLVEQNNAIKASQQAFINQMNLPPVG